MNPKKYIIRLSGRQRQALHDITARGNHPARVIKRAHALQKSAEGWTDAAVAEYIETSKRTVEHIRTRFAEGGLERALYDAKRSGQPKKLDEKAEAHLVALACSDAPEGRDHWTLELLQKRMIEDRQVKTISTVALWHRMRDHDLKPWREKNVVRPEDHAGVHPADGGRA